MNQTTGFQKILSWIEDLLGSKQRPLFLGINGPQGCGKSTLATTVVEALESRSIHAISLSIDDFYLTHNDQIRLSKRFPDNPYLQSRGYPGTHDIELGVRTLEALRNIHSTQTVKCPVYDKSMNQGQGDRLPEDQWKTARSPLDLVILDGWMLGFKSVSSHQLPNDFFIEINEFLKKYECWDKYLAAFIQLEPEKIDFYIAWRIEAEEKAKQSGKSGMSREEIEKYAKTFLLAYETYLPNLKAHPPSVAQFIRVCVAKNRSLQF